MTLRCVKLKEEIERMAQWIHHGIIDKNLVGYDKNLMNYIDVGIVPI